jgi:hypothetical protein
LLSRCNACGLSLIGTFFEAAAAAAFKVFDSSCSSFFPFLSLFIETTEEVEHGTWSYDDDDENDDEWRAFLCEFESALKVWPFENLRVIGVFFEMVVDGPALIFCRNKMQLHKIRMKIK